MATTYTGLEAGTALTGTEIIPMEQSGELKQTTAQDIADLGGGIQIQQSRVTAQFDKTSDTVLADITGLTATLVAGKTYRFEAKLYTSADLASGIKFAIGGTATATNFIAQILINIIDNSSLIGMRLTSLGSSRGVTGSDVGYVLIDGVITVNAAGTLAPQFAQNVSGGIASSVLVGSTFVVTEII